MANAFIARQRQHPQERDSVQYKLACEAPPPVDWRSEARRALASDRLSLDDSGRILRAAGAPTGFVIDPLINGRSVYIRDEYGTRYWLGPPNRLRAVLRWLLS